MADDQKTYPNNDPPTVNGAPAPTPESGDRPAFKTDEVSESADKNSLSDQAPLSAQESTPPPPTSAILPGEGVAPAASGGEQENAQKLTEVTGIRKKPKVPGSLKKVVIVSLVIVFGLLATLLAVRFFSGDSGGRLFGEKGEVVWWGFRDDIAIYQPVIEKFEKENPGIKIVYQKQSPVDYRERLTNALASGQGPDVFEIHNSWIPMFATDLEPASNSVLSKEEYARDYYPAIVSSLSGKDKVQALALEYDALTLYINDDIFSSAAKLAPGSWNELRDLAVELTQRDSSKLVIQSGAALGFVENIDYWPEIVALMMVQNGANLSRPADERTQDAVNFYKAFNKPLAVWDTRLPSSTIAFSRGRVAMYFAPARAATEIVKLNPSLKFHTVVLPQLPKNAPTDPDYSYATFWAQGVWNKSANKDLAWQFLKYMAEDENLRLINQKYKETYGLERLYPKPQLNSGFRDHAILGSIMQLGFNAKTWYLADSTNDGTTGINTKINAIFEEALTKGVKAEEVGSQVRAVLSQYGI